MELVKNNLIFLKLDISQAKDYAAEDADITFRLYKIFLKSLKAEKLLNIYELFEKPLIKILADMEIKGIKLDKSSLNKLSSKFSSKIEKLEKSIFKISKKNLILDQPNNLVK